MLFDAQVVTVLGYSRPVIELVARVIKDTYELPVETRQIQLGSIEAVNLKLDPRSSLVVYCPRREGNSFVLLDTILRPLRGDCPSAMSEEEWRARKLGSLKTSRMDNAYFGVITLLDRRLAFALVDDTATHGMCPSNDDNLVAKKLESLRDNLIRDLQYHGLFNSTDANYTPIVLSLDSSCDKLNQIQAQAIQHELDAVGRQPLSVTLPNEVRDWFQKPNWYPPPHVIVHQTCFQAACILLSKHGRRVVLSSSIMISVVVVWYVVGYQWTMRTNTQ
ncbi:hypothetical protein BASA81_001682 [Batrachochytrium salamandrivorans]|nr:hypothetical protein BASA81_001682 [Batrachochytrium salamandrivorans]